MVDVFRHVMLLMIAVQMVYSRTLNLPLLTVPVQQVGYHFAVVVGVQDQNASASTPFTPLQLILDTGSGDVAILASTSTSFSPTIHADKGTLTVDHTLYVDMTTLTFKNCTRYKDNMGFLTPRT